MLDGLTGQQAPSPAPAPGGPSRALRSARGAVDETKVWRIDPDHVTDDRPEDRLRQDPDPELLRSIEEAGQTVPILVRRDPRDADRYRLIYGRRRLDAVRGINEGRDPDDRLLIRALIRDLDDRAAVTAQASENAARRDLSYAEKALFAHRLIEDGFGSQDEVAAALSTTKSAVSMSLSVVRVLTPELIRAIGPAHGVGRPRWEALRDAVRGCTLDREELIRTAEAARNRSKGPEKDAASATGQEDPGARDLRALEAVLRAARAHADAPADPGPAAPRAARVTVDGAPAGTVKRTRKGVRLDLTAEDDAFAAWLEERAPEVIRELHARYNGAGDNEDEQQKGGTNAGST
jgi:ParB family chromosome partitioning protein